jgi:hypothetical protein
MTITNMHVHVQQPPNPDPRALKILAKSLYRELRTQGYDAKQVVSLATELISQVTSELERDTASR